METLESLKQRTLVAVEALPIYHWRGPGPTTICGIDYAYARMKLHSVAEIEETHITCGRCAAIVEKMEKGWGG